MFNGRNELVLINEKFMDVLVLINFVIMSLKRFLLFIFLFFTSFFSYSQTGIGVADPAVDAALEVRSNNKGFLPPRLTVDERDSIANPTTGLVIL